MQAIACKERTAGRLAALAVHGDRASVLIDLTHCSLDYRSIGGSCAVVAANVATTRTIRPHSRLMESAPISLRRAGSEERRNVSVASAEENDRASPRSFV